MKKNIRSLTLILISLTLLNLSSAATDKRIPTVDDLLLLKSAGGARISPDGTSVAYTVTETDFKQDAYVTQIWLADTRTGRTFPLTRGDKSSVNPEWSPDGTWLSFTSPRIGDKNQIFLIRPDGGEAVALTKSELGVGGYAWSPDGRTIAYAAVDPTPQILKDRKDQYGDYDVVRREYAYNHLWTVDVDAGLKEPQAGKRRTQGKDFSIGSFSWSPDGARISFSATVNPDLIQSVTSDIYVLNLADDSIKKIVDLPGPDSAPLWSPDGRQILFSSVLGRTDNAVNTRLALVPAGGGTPRALTESFDENPGFVAWTGDGIYFAAQQKTSAHMFRLDPATLGIVRITNPDGFMGGSFSFSRDGKQMAFTAATPTTLTEIFVSDLPFAPKKLTNLTAQADAFILGSREVISWTSKDGTVIEGVLIKPADFDPTKKYALLCVIHGGPTGVDRPALLSPDTRYYPSDIWAARGALILKVNYRGSAGYGEKFRRLNIRNLGVGDAWDVLSGVDFLVKKGWVDPGRIGCMG
jgi:dipeptidyl aminopeptidase/acylaminoacyl peptidase